MFRRLRRQLTLVCVTITGIVLIGMAAASFYFSVRQLRTQFDAHFESSVNTVYYVIRSQPAISHAWLKEMEAKEHVLVDIRSARHTMMFSGSLEKRLPLFEEAVRMADERGINLQMPAGGGLIPQSASFEMQGDYSAYRAAVAKIPAEQGDLLVSVLEDRSVQERQIRSLLIQYIACVVVSALLLLLFGWVFTGYTVRPIERNRKQQIEFVSAASHELRSPLAVVQICSEKIQDATLEEARHYGRAIGEECIRLSRLTNDLLELAGADNQSWKMHPVKINPDAVILNAVEHIELPAAAKAISLRVELPQESLPLVLCDPRRLEQSLIALLDNAVRYTPAGGRIDVAANTEPPFLAISVSDSGPGVPEHQRDRIFDRFYQADAARTDKEHFGLGLSIVKEIVQYHKGRVQVRESQYGGAEFVLFLPLAVKKQGM